MKKIPAQDKWIQTNNSDILGNIWSSFNIDTQEQLGKIRIGKRLLLNTNTTDVSYLTSYPVGFEYFNGGIYTAAGLGGTGYCFANNGTLSGIFSRKTGTHVPTSCDSTISDIKVFGSKIYVSTASNIVYYSTNGETWGTEFSVGGTDDASTHMFCVYAGRLYMTKLGSQILSFDSSHTVASLGNPYTIGLGNTEENTITFIKSSSNTIWIGTVNTIGGKGNIYQWDGISAQVDKTYKLDSSGALACVIKDDVPYIFDTNGNLLSWNGGTFKLITGLNRENNKKLFNATSSINNRFVHPNGMAISRGKINILIDGVNGDSTDHTGTQEETIPSGIYEYDEHTESLIHKHSFGLSKAGETIIDYGQFKITGAGAMAEIVIADEMLDGSFIAGASYYPTASSTSSGIFYDNIFDTEQKSGYLITSKIRADNIVDAWNEVYLRYRKLLNASDRIFVKYRTEESDYVDATITWTSTTSFTTTTNVTEFSPQENNGIGGEVEIQAGRCAGTHSQVLTAGGNDVGGYTITVNRPHTGANFTSQARFHKWIEIGNVNTTKANFDEFPIGETSTWIQFKIWMLFTGKNELEDILVDNAKSR